MKSMDSAHKINLEEGETQLDWPADSKLYVPSGLQANVIIRRGNVESILHQ